MVYCQWFSLDSHTGLVLGFCQNTLHPIMECQLLLVFGILISYLSKFQNTVYLQELRSTRH